MLTSLCRQSPLALCLFTLCLLPTCIAEGQAPTLVATSETTETQSESPLRWWKGNLHTHSLWSDGDDFPEMIADWYASRGYNFLALSDHNILSQGQRWMKFEAIVKRAEPDVLEKYQTRFGSEWVETRGKSGEKDFEVRLKPLDEFGPLLNRAGKFLMIPGEEISDRAEGKPVHMNATNLQELIRPLGGDTVRETMENNLRSVLEQEKALGKEILAHLNHPNFGYAVTAEDLGYVIQERFFEVYNGHPAVNQLGDKEHMSIEKMWDTANAIRVCLLDAEPLFGIATDDSHEYHGRPGSTPGRGWVMVQSRFLTPEHLIKSMKRGDFYASSGVSLSKIQWDADRRRLSLEIAKQEGIDFVTEFVGIREAKSGEMPAPGDIGVILGTSDSLTPSFDCPNGIRLLRARVRSTEPHPNPSLKNQVCEAWTQPVVLPKK